MGKLQALSGAASVVQNRCGNPCHTVLGSIELYRRAQCRGGKIDRELKSRPHLRVRPAVGGDDGNRTRLKPLLAPYRSLDSRGLTMLMGLE